MWLRLAGVVVAALIVSGCVILENLEDALFPPLPPNPFEQPPLPLGPVPFEESRVGVANLGDGNPGGITVFAPAEGAGNGAAVVWILGLNQRAYYQQSLHEHLASYGYTVLVPDTRRYTFVDMAYHSNLIANAVATADRVARGRIVPGIDPERIAFGGYEIGGALAAFAAVDFPAAAVFAWAPIEPPFWMRFETEDILPGLTQPVLLIEGALDAIAVPGTWQATLQAYAATPPGDIISVVIGQAVHHYFQEPDGADMRNPSTTITRAEQMARAIGATHLWLDFVIGQPLAD